MARVRIIVTMPSIRNEIVVPAALDEPAREAFIDEVYGVNARIFDIERDVFVRSFANPAAESTRVQVFRDSTGRLVGYTAFHMFRHRIRGRDSILLRSQTGKLREHRGGPSVFRFALAEGLRHVAQNPGVPMYFFAGIVHPTSYSGLCKYMRPVWPSREVPPDAELRALLAEIGDGFGFPRVGEDPLVRNVGWKIRDTEAERAFWQRCDKPDVRFYLEHNPTYGQGHALLTLVPVTPAIVAAGIARLARDKGSQRLEDLRARAHHLPLASRVLLPREIRRRLRAVRLFDGLDEAQLDALAARAEIVRLAAGLRLVTEGERGEDLFVIDRGAVHVTASRGGEDVLLEQLDPGDVLGEIGALGGEPRTASARTATRATLVRIGRRALLEAMDADPALASSIWARYAERRFEYAAETHPAFARTSRAERFAFLRQGEPVELEAGRSRVLRGPALLFVVRGEVALERAEARVVGRGPLLLDVGDALHVHARTAAQLVELPAPPRPAAFGTFRSHPLLAGLGDAELVELLLAGRPIRLEGDESLFSQADPADAFYFVLSGAVEIVEDGVAIKRLGPGECFGERGLDPRGSGLRTAGARTAGLTELSRVVGEEFRRIAGAAVHGSTDPSRPGW